MATFAVTVPPNIVGDATGMSQLREGLGMAAAAHVHPEIEALPELFREAAYAAWEQLVDAVIDEMAPLVASQLESAIAARLPWSPEDVPQHPASRVQGGSLAPFERAITGRVLAEFNNPAIENARQVKEGLQYLIDLVIGSYNVTDDKESDSVVAEKWLMDQRARLLFGLMADVRASLIPKVAERMGNLLEEFAPPAHLVAHVESKQLRADLAILERSRRADDRVAKIRRRLAGMKGEDLDSRGSSPDPIPTTLGSGEARREDREPTQAELDAFVRRLGKWLADGAQSPRRGSKG